MGLKLNELSPALGAKKKSLRRGRGIGSGLGKTGGRGIKGQTSRSGSSISAGFEGGQMPIYRRLPKFGFTSKLSMVTAEVRLSELNKIEGDVVSLDTLKAANIVRRDIKRAKIIQSGELTRKLTFKGVKVTKGAKVVIESLGGNVEE